MSNLQQTFSNQELLQSTIAELRYDFTAQDKIHIKECNLCRGQKLATIAHLDRYGYKTKTRSCLECGLTFLSPRLTAGAYKDFYARIYRPLVSAYHGRLINAQTVKEEQAVYADEMAEFLESFLESKRGMNFLDVGGSTGVVAARLASQFDLKATVIDPSLDEINEASALGLETITALVEEWNPRGRHFEVIGMFQTIDHLLDISATLKKLREVITDDGIFVLDIVDFRAVYLRNWSVERAVKIDHPFSLTEETAKAFLARAGFEVVSQQYSEDRHLVAYICRPCAPQPDAVPPPASVEEFFREIRFVQCARLPSVIVGGKN